VLQGNFIADIAYFTGKDANLYIQRRIRKTLTSLLEGYAYDLINAETILKRIKIENSQIVLPDGMSYKILGLQNYKTITHELLGKLCLLMKRA
jgi:hypothetical protein